MMQSNFQIAFDVTVSHSYFENGICNCLRFNPGTVTQALLKRFEIKKRSKADGFEFYINSRTSLPAFLTYIGNSTGNTFFDFDIETTAPAFNLFTEIPANWLGQLVYDSSDSSNTTDAGVVQLCVNPVASISAGSFGKLTVHFDDIIKSVAGGCAQFAINYASRATQWQYFIVNKSAVQLESPEISGKAGISFTGPENVTIGNGQEAMLFTSGDKLIPLSEVPKHKFDLVNRPAQQGNQKPSSAKIIFKGLPNPDPVRIGIDTTTGSSLIVSPMYVYV